MLTATLLVLGCLMIGSAIHVELYHQEIWARSKKNYKKSGNGLVDVLKSPNQVAYLLNRFLVWPLVGLVGLAAIATAIGNFLA